MNHTSLPLQQLCDAAIQAALEAGQFVQSADRSRLQRRFKDTGSSAASQLVTEVDIRSEAIIRERLQATLDELDIAFVGEESSRSVPGGPPGGPPERLHTPYHWCVDPLDGTLPFVEGNPGYAISIALVSRSGSPLIGVVYDPVTSTLLHAIRGQGAYRDETPLLRPTTVSTVLVVFADRSFEAHEHDPDFLDTLTGCAGEFGLKGFEVVYGSGAVKNACQVLNHGAACYLKLPKRQDGGGSIWDFAASACIVKEAGGWSSNIHGQPLALNRPDSTFMNHQGVLYASTEQIAKYLIERLTTATGF